MAKLRVGVLMGGESSEREVSLMTGREMIKNLDRSKYDVVAIELSKGSNNFDKKMDVALIALHGKGGEDGVIQGYLETLGIKYTGCGVLASAVGMDKKIFREVMIANKLPMPRLVTHSPCVVKPCNGGSSVGVSVVKNIEELGLAISKAKRYDDEIIIEEYLKGTEVSCGVLGNDVLPVIEIVPKNQFFDYESKYTESGALEICPARISKKMSKRIQKLTLKVFEAIKGRGYARVDFIIKNNKPYILEINTLPGMTAVSLLPKEALAVGINYSQLLDKIIELALKKPLE
jgi:D-alanine-D-alanine ligase